MNKMQAEFNCDKLSNNEDNTQNKMNKGNLE